MASLGFAILLPALVWGMNSPQHHMPEADEDLAGWSHRPQ